MTKYQKEQIISLRANGEACSKIAESLGLSVNTVKSYCRRNITGANANAKAKNTQAKSDASATATDHGDSGACPQCGNKITQTEKRKHKRFCSDKCRMAWWNSHPEDVKQRALYPFKCISCGKDFIAYGNAKRRYCSHSCYCKDRFGHIHPGRAEKEARGKEVRGKGASV